MGRGRNAVFLAELGHRVVATDIAENGLAKARKLASARRVNVGFRHLDLQGWQWLEAVVAVFIQFAAPALRDEIFSEMKRSVPRWAHPAPRLSPEAARVSNGRAADRRTAVHGVTPAGGL
jgi:Methyltransferase domain